MKNTLDTGAASWRDGILVLQAIVRDFSGGRQLSGSVQEQGGEQGMPCMLPVSRTPLETKELVKREEKGL